MCVETLRTGLIFPRRSDLRGHMPKFTSQNKHFLIYLLGIPINVCWNPKNMASFFQEDLIWRVTCLCLLSKWTWFPIYLLGNPIYVFWNPQNQGLIFRRRFDLRGHIPWFYSEKWTFSHLSPWKPHKCVLIPSEQGLFFWDDWFEGSTCLALL